MPQLLTSREMLFHSVVSRIMLAKAIRNIIVRILKKQLTEEGDFSN